MFRFLRGLKDPIVRSGILELESLCRLRIADPGGGCTPGIFIPDRAFRGCGYVWERVATARGVGDQRKKVQLFSGKLFLFSVVRRHVLHIHD